jgi:hypothetical protein
LRNDQLQSEPGCIKTQWEKATSGKTKYTMFKGVQEKEKENRRKGKYLRDFVETVQSILGMCEFVFGKPLVFFMRKSKPLHKV